MAFDAWNDGCPIMNGFRSLSLKASFFAAGTYVCGQTKVLALLYVSMISHTSTRRN